MKRCRTCRAVFPDGYNFCTRCGSAAPKYPTFKSVSGGVGKGLCFVFIFLAAQFVISIIYSLIYYAVALINNPELISDADFAGEITEGLLGQMNFISIGASVLTLIIVFLFFKLTHRNVFSELGNRRFSAWKIPLIIILGIALNYFTTFGMSFIPVPESAINSYEEIYSYMGEGNPIVEFISIAVLAPVTEEVIFRGMCYGSMRGVMPRWLAAVISAVIFGAVHGNPISLVYAGLLGIVMVAVYEKTGSIAAPILLHFGFNAGSYVVSLTPEYDSILFYAIILFAAALISVVCFAFIFYGGRQGAAEEALYAHGEGSENSYFEISNVDPFINRGSENDIK